MKLNIEKIKMMVGSLSKRGGYRLGENPSADWVLALVGFFVLAALFVLFTIIKNPAASSPPTPESASASSELISNELMNRVGNYIEERRGQFESLRDNPNSLVDPSQ